MYTYIYMFVDKSERAHDQEHESEERFRIIKDSHLPHEGV